jgi:hypothetical protein
VVPVCPKDARNGDLRHDLEDQQQADHGADMPHAPAFLLSFL